MPYRRKRPQTQRRKKPCECCGVEVQYATAEEYLRHSRVGGPPVLCGQCGRYIARERRGDGEILVTARTTEVDDVAGLMRVGLRRKRGRGAKMKGVLESCPLGRVLPTTCENSGAVCE